MLQLIYIVAFTVLALLAMANLIRSLLTLGIESQRQLSPPRVTIPNSWIAMAT